ncbi:hypothetical protein KIN20_014873 [Parelaphostrongylus tenuis]|uniref:tRNA:m(4)X modification enzyme TRM13 n=1 Tax=Parelaphostrongylus tenuis TaxID=148309 RepID=A0AAD5QS44_PARTN|nr:hypothetical protein KIN20_014873 [Parelaphostrongylus tenuis]
MPSPSTYCAFVVPKKQRSCRMLVKAGQKFCGEHAIFDEDNQDRIPCPYDPKHTIDRRAVATHLKRCNSRLLERRWVIENINSIKGEVRSIDKIDRKARNEEIISVIHKLLLCYDSICEEIEKKQLEIPEIRDHLEQFPEISDTKRKHLVQQSSIIGHLESTKLLKNEPSACIFELGAGKAQLSYWMAKRAPSASFLLIDRSGSRNKYDNKALQENPSLNINGCAVRSNI